MEDTAADALREVLKDMAEATELGIKSGQALIAFLEDMLSFIEAWAAKYEVTLQSEPAIPHYQRLLLNPPSQVNPAYFMDRSDNNMQVLADRKRLPERLRDGEASTLLFAQCPDDGAQEAVYGRNTVGSSPYQARFGSSPPRSGDNVYHKEMCGHASYLETDNDIEERAKTGGAYSLKEDVKEERKQYSSKCESLGEGAGNSSLVDNASLHTNVAPELALYENSDTCFHHVGEDGGVYGKPSERAVKYLKLDAALPLSDVKTEPHV